MTRLISYVIPCYGSERTIEGVVGEIQQLQRNHPEDEYEIILVNDSSPDNVWSVIQQLVENNSNIIAINLAKNFGQHAALMAGYRHASGDLIVSLDDDGQIAVEDTYKLIDHLEDGFDVVYGKYRVKKHSIFRNFGSWMCGWMMVHIMGVPKDFSGSSFFVARKYVIDEVAKYPNAYVFMLGLVFRTTDKVDSVFVDHRSREIGASGYTFSKLLALWVNGATTFSVKPLRVSAMMGSIIACIGVISSCAIIIKKILNPDMVAGWSSLMAVTLILCGTILIVLGMLGEYVGRLYMSSNRTPQYVIREQIGKENCGTERVEKVE